MASKYKWFSFENEKDSAKYNFFCFPHAGAGASLYASWGKIIPDDYSYFYYASKSQCCSTSY